MSSAMPGALGVDAAPQLDFSVDEVGVLEPSAVPTLRFAVRIEASEGVAIRSLALNVQLRIAATRRGYDEQAERRLYELFGAPEQWSRSLRSLHWTNVGLQVGPFSGTTIAELPVPCSYDLELTATRYFSALSDGEVPVELLFSGSLFYATDGGLRVAPLPWDREAEARMPVEVWRRAIDRHFPGSAWLRLGRPSFEALHAYRARRALTSWEQTIDSLLREAGEEPRAGSEPAGARPPAGARQGGEAGP